MRPALAVLLALVMALAQGEAPGSCSPEDASQGLCQVASPDAPGAPAAGGLPAGAPTEGDTAGGKPMGGENDHLAAEPKAAVRHAKTCVYTIALNERAHVDAFMAAVKGADVVSITDTGSSDGTPEALEEAGAQVHRIMLRPFRFDTARNIALSLLPADCDLCLAFDLDEYVQPGWEEALQAAWAGSGGRATALRYQYVWSWRPDGVTPDQQFTAHKIHARMGYTWRDPAHELPYFTGPPGGELAVAAPGLVLHHRAVPKPSRSGYLPLLELGAREEPRNARRAHYHGRELMYAGRWDDAIAELERHVALPDAGAFPEEQAASLRYIAQCHRNQRRLREAQRAALRGVLAWQLTREPWLEVARTSHALEDWPTVFWAAHKALAITERHQSGIWGSTTASWGAEPHDLLALSAYYLGAYSPALEHGTKAVELDPNNERLRENLEYYKAKAPARSEPEDCA